MERNPFAMPSGEPLPGKLDEFVKFQADQWEKHLASLSPEEKHRVLASKRDLSRRMASETQVS